MASTYEATNVVLSKIKNLEPENASKIMGYLLMNLEDSELVRLACSPDPVLHSILLRVKTNLGLSLPSPSPSSPSPLNPITRPSSSTTSSNNNPFSKFSPSPRVATNGFDFTRNPSSPSSPWSLPGFPNYPISPKSSPLLSYDNIRTSSSSFSPRLNGDCNAVRDFVDEQQVDEHFPFLGESSKNEELFDPRLEMGLESHNLHSLNNGDAHFHRRSFSASDACFGFEEGGPGLVYKPCLYFARGFCKNGTNCKFVHGGMNDSLGAIAGSPSRFEGLEQHEELMRLKAAQHQRLMAASQLVGGGSPSSYDKYVDFLMMQQNDPRRAAAAAAFMMGEEFHNFGRGRLERNDFLAMISDKPNSAAQQIYLTFPAESTFKDDDVSEYFSKFGPVQDVRIPYQQKRMFGFVTFVYPETVRLILSKGNPHFICDSRVLVKPYKEKGKVSEKRQQQQQLEREDFSPCLSPSGFDSKEPFDFHTGARMLYNPHDILLRRKFEEQAELQQVLELQERRLKNLQLPDFKNIPIHHHQRSLSVGAPFPLTPQLQSQVSNGGLGLSSDNVKGDVTGYLGSLSSNLSLGTAAEQQPQLHKEFGSAVIADTESSNEKDDAEVEIVSNNRSVEPTLPDSFFASPTKASGDNLSDLSTLAEVNESASSSSQNQLEQQPTTSVEMASH